MIRTSNLTLEEMIGIFCDGKAIPEKVIENYYFLVADLLKTKNIPKNSIIFKALIDCISELESKQRDYITLRYGLNDTKFRVLDDIDKNVSKERVRQVLYDAFVILNGKKTRYNVLYRIEILKARKNKVDSELEYYQKIINNNIPIQLTLRDFHFSTRVNNVLKRNKITSYEQLMELTPKEMLKMRNLGIKSANEIWFQLHGEEIHNSTAL